MSDYHVNSFTAAEVDAIQQAAASSVGGAPLIGQRTAAKIGRLLRENERATVETPAAAA